MFRLTILTKDNEIVDHYKSQENLVQDSINIIVPCDIICKKGVTNINLLLRCNYMNKHCLISVHNNIYKTPIRIANGIQILQDNEELYIKVDNFSDEEYTIKKGDVLFKLYNSKFEKGICKIATITTIHDEFIDLMTWG